MEEKQSWDWSTQLKEIPLKEWESRFNWVEDICISRDGESIAGIVNLDEMAFGICENGELWEGEHEKAWSLKALPDNRFAACVCVDEEWGLMVDGKAWENRFDFIWHLCATPDGAHVGLAFQNDMEYGMAVDDSLWESTYENMTGMVLGQQGRTAAVVQAEPMAAADVAAFSQGLFTVAVDGRISGERYLNAWDIAFDATGEHQAWAVRLDREQYSIAVNDTVWDNRFQAVWAPVFCDREKSVAAPVRNGGKWQLYKNDALFWTGKYENIWRLLANPANVGLAAVVAPAFGRWGVAENDIVWPVTWDTMVRDIYYSEDGNVLLAVFKDRGYWGLAKDGKPWQ
ncbi:MAG: Tmc redox complex protein TmcD, partial [Desulfobacterales bacterium]|nr:Tmc redox complex protein TmcD [Desulfobacterales bacterium]